MNDHMHGDALSKEAKAVLLVIVVVTAFVAAGLAIARVTGDLSERTHAAKTKATLECIQLAEQKTPEVIKACTESVRTLF